jgi:hypothetical protein
LNSSCITIRLLRRRHQRIEPGDELGAHLVVDGGVVADLPDLLAQVGGVVIDEGAVGDADAMIVSFHSVMSEKPKAMISASSRLPASVSATNSSSDS